MCEGVGTMTAEWPCRERGTEPWCEAAQILNKARFHTPTQLSQLEDAREQMRGTHVLQRSAPHELLHVDHEHFVGGAAAG